MACIFAAFKATSKNKYIQSSCLHLLGLCIIMSALNLTSLLPSHLAAVAAAITLYVSMTIGTLCSQIRERSETKRQIERTIHFSCKDGLGIYHNKPANHVAPPAEGF